MLIDAKSKDAVWTYEVRKSSHGELLLGTHAARGQQSLAEVCAERLKDFIEKVNNNAADSFGVAHPCGFCKGGPFLYPEGNLR
jgi:hypothetical protein